MPESEGTTTNRVATNGDRTFNAEQLSVFSELVSRLNFAKRHGMQYGSDRDMYEVGGYPRTLEYKDFESLWDRDPIAAQIVDMPAETTWRAAPTISEPDQENGTEFTAAWEDLAKRLHVWSRFERLDKLSRIGRYGVLLIGTPDATDQKLKEEMGRLKGPEDVLYLSAYSEKHAEIATWVEDPSDERYGLPETYRINLAGDVSSFRSRAAAQTEHVHWSRVIHVAEDTLEDDVYGREALRRVYNDLHDLQKIKTATGEAFWQRVAGILKAVIDPESKISDTDIEKLDDHLKELYHELRKTFYGQGVDLERLAESEPDPEQAAALYMTCIAAGAKIPKRMLFGSETGERASSEDQKTYLGRIAERHTQHAEPSALRPLIDRLIDRNALPRPGRQGYDVVWPDLFKEPEKDAAEANKSRAEAAKALTPMGGDPSQLVEIDEERNVWLVPRKAGAESPFTPDMGEEPGPPEAGEEPEDGEPEEEEAA